VATPCLFLILSCVFQRVLELEVAAVEHQFVFIDEAGFNLTKRRKRGRNIIGQRAIVEVPGQRGGNITMCAAITHHGVIHHHATLGPYNTAHLITFLDTLHNTLIPPDQVDGPEQLRYVVIWDNVSFHRAALVRNWFTAHPRFLVVSTIIKYSCSKHMMQLSLWFYTFMHHCNRLERKVQTLELQFFSIVYTHFLKACLIFSVLYTQIQKKHTQWAKPLNSPAK